MELENITYDSLQKYDYRYLQRIGKYYNLPSNVKKLQLCELILAKKHGTEEHLNALVTQVKAGQQTRRFLNKTHKRSGKQLKFQRFKRLTLEDSDRILRSFNSHKPNNEVKTCIDTPIKIAKSQNPMQMTQDRNSSSTEKPLPLSMSVLKNPDISIMPAQKNIVTTGNPPLKYQRAISDRNHESQNTRFESIPTVGFRHNDGNISQINAIVKKPNKTQQYHPIKVTMQEVIDRKVDINYEMDPINHSFSCYLKWKTFGKLDNHCGCTVNLDKGNQREIQSEQRREVNVGKKATLPSIDTAFSHFNEIQRRDLMQPLYVQVNQEPQSDNTLQYNNNTAILEPLYNLRAQLTHQPLLTTVKSNTKTVFSTSTRPTVFAHQTPGYNEFNNTDAYNFVSSADTITPLATVTALDGNGPVSQMDDTFGLMDAFELISQDGDYMRNLGLEDRVQCMLCDWTGSTIILDYHIKKVHENEVIHNNNPNFIITVTLEVLISREMWQSQIMKYNEDLYAINTRYTEDWIYVMLNTLSSVTTPRRGQITVYNKVTGQPFSWEGEILPILYNSPSSADDNCLKLDINSLDLLPNSAKLKLINKKLKLMTNNKVIIGQLSLSDIELVLHISLLD